MSQALLDELKQENLCTHFVLPLLKLSKVSFAPLGFINCYLTKECDRVAVKVVDISLLSQMVKSHPNLSFIYKYEDSYLITFRIGQRWNDDVRLFCAGKYSKMSAKAKEFIIRYSGLDYRAKDGNQVKTDGRLLALEKHALLKGMWEKLLWDSSGKYKDDPDIHLPDEYLSAPGEESFISPIGLQRTRDMQL